MFIPRSWLSSWGLCGLSLFLFACGAREEKPPAASAAAAETELAATGAELDAIVGTYRRILVLMSDEATLAALDRPRSFLAGKLLFERNRHALAALEAAGEASLEAAREEKFRADPKPVLAVLDRLELDPLWRDADKLAFRDLLSAWTAKLREAAPSSPKGKALLLRLAEDLQALDQIQQLYEKEIEKVFAQFGTRGIPVRREAWESYLAFLRQELSAQAIFDQLRPELPPPPPVVLPAKTKAIDGAQLPEKTLVLTFDDGPHGANTPKILEILKRYGAPAIFFAVGENLGRYDAKGAFAPSKAAAATRAALAAGHLLANHTLSHQQLPKLEAAGVTEQIDEMSRRARELDPAGIKLFRPPYGAYNDEVARQAAERQLKLMLWNIDSQDWADPVAASIANRVVAEARSSGRGIVLFHDIHARTVEALPLVIETLQAEGYRFVLWDGDTLTEPRGLPAPADRAAPAEPAPALYAESHAVVIGIDDYQHWPKLTYAVADALALRELLVRRLGFSPANVHMLLDREATREKILELLGERMADPARVGKEDRLLVFYAGHGATRQLGSGRSLGYVVPADAALDRLHSQAISMTQFGDIDEALPAKHVLYLMDACYGGLALLRGGGSRNFLRETTQRRARQMITAGGADELVADGGPGGHSIFTWTLLQGLGGEADLNRDGYVTATELFAYTGPLVAQLSRQTPAFGSLPGSEGGEMVFALEPDEEFLSAESTQLDEEAIALNQQLVEVRSEIAARKDRNSKLKRELDQAREELARLSQQAPGTGANLPVRRRARDLHEQGLELFRQKNYGEALAALREAVELAPDSALYVNNLGFVHYRRGELDQALEYYQKTKELDPARIQVYMNEGSAFEALGRKEEAAASYRKFLELAPDHRDAGYARRRLEALAAGG
jgi:peptidoglycan/xylan/chitin deacetylase (PgdA/CDA1 family)/Flp pilus assembly protein TadD